MELPKKIFQHEDGQKKIFTEGSKANKTTLVSNITNISFHDGIYVEYEGASYPQKGIATPEILYNVNIMKAVFMSVFRLRPNINSLITEFNHLGIRIISQFFLKDEYMTAGGFELKKLTGNFIKPFVLNGRCAEQFGTIISHLVEYDNAYRLRLVDIASETSKELLLRNPRKEIKRLLGIIYDREIQFEDVKKKFKYIGFVLRLVLLTPRFKKAFKNAVRESDFSKMQYDNIDRYWACLRTDYNFMGMSYNDRKELLKTNGLVEPIQKEIHVG